MQPPLCYYVLMTGISTCSIRLTDLSRRGNCNSCRIFVFAWTYCWKVLNIMTHSHSASRKSTQHTSHCDVHQPMLCTSKKWRHAWWLMTVVWQVFCFFFTHTKAIKETFVLLTRNDPGLKESSLRNECKIFPNNEHFRANCCFLLSNQCPWRLLCTSYPSIPQQRMPNCVPSCARVLSPSYQPCWLILSNSVFWLLPGLLRLPVQSQEHGGDTSSRSGVCSFVEGGTEGTLHEPYTMTFLIKYRKTVHPTTTTAAPAHRLSLPTVYFA